jgi:methionyl-tRNA formyltransferase
MNRPARMRTLLICHDGALLDQEGLRQWLASFSDLAGVIVLREPGKRTWRRVIREVKRVGMVRFADVLAFRLYRRLVLAPAFREWERASLEQIRATYPAVSNSEVLFTGSPNSREADEFISRLAPDLMIARCKTLLKENIFTLPAAGTFVLHPGICPEYRNAHGVFWALANGATDKVGLTLLRIDKGVDTGPVYGYFSYDYDEMSESHLVITERVLFDNLDAVAKRLVEIHSGVVGPIETAGRPSATWGQPWLTAYFRWRRAARRRMLKLLDEPAAQPD